MSTRWITKILVVLVGISLFTVGLTYGQPKVPTESSSSDLFSELLKVIERLLSDEPKQRESAAAELRQMDAKAVPLFINIIYHMKDKNLKIFAGDALAIIGEPAVNPLIEALKESKDEDVRVAAAAALTKVGQPAIGPLIEALSDLIRDPYIDAVAYHILWKIGEPSVEPLIAALKQNDNIFVRSIAAGVLGEIKNKRAVVPLIDALKDKDIWIRGNAAEALGKIKDACAIEPLIATLKDDDLSVQKKAAQALKDITEQEMGNDQTKWLEWWEKNKSKYKNACNR